MIIKDLAIEIKNELLKQRQELHVLWRKNNAYHVCFTNKEGTRYFTAERICMSWSDNKGHYMPFGGGTYWQIKYGRIKCAAGKDIMGEPTYQWIKSKEIFSKSLNGTDIPKEVKTKNDVIKIAKQIGTLVM